jgi:hypothetical protein
VNTLVLGIALLIAAAVLSLGGSPSAALFGAGCWFALIGLTFDTGVT